MKAALSIEKQIFFEKINKKIKVFLTNPLIFRKKDVIILNCMKSISLKAALRTLSAVR